MEAGTTSTTLTARLPILNPREYDLWLMRIEQYFLMTNYSLWEVILNGNKVLKRQVEETEQEYEATNAEEKQDRRNEMKARGTLLMALPNKDQLKFHSYKDAKLLMEAIEKSSETMDQTFDRLQKLISQLEIQGEVIAQEDMNLKLTNSNSNINEADNTAYGVSVAHTLSNPVNSTSVDNLRDTEMGMLTIRAIRFIKRTGKKLDINGQRIRFDRSKVECYNCHKNSHFARECKAPRNQENRGRENGRRIIKVETPTENALIAQDGIGGYDWSYQAEEEHPTNFAFLNSDNGTEFKNSVMNQFCKMKGIKREFSVAGTPQQNAVNTACYVLNRVLVIKPNSKTPYELIRGRTPLIDFMKPFGCHVTILNTRDHLGKFDGKADEGFFVGYSVVSKAIREFNKRTRIVEETLNIRFLKNAPNVTRNGPDWLFDVDSLSKSMNYVLVVARNQTNGIAGTRDNIVAGPKDSKEDAGVKPTKVDESEASDKDGKDKQDSRSDTLVSTAEPSSTFDAPSSPVNAAKTYEEHLIEQFSPFKNAFTLPDVLNVSSMDDNTRIFFGAYDDEDVGGQADLNNLETTMNVNSIPTTRINKDHLIELIIIDLHSAPLTRRMSQQNLEEHCLVSYINKQRRTNHKDYQNYLFACFLSQKEPKKVIQSLEDPSWIEAMQEELLQFEFQKVWTLVDLPNGKRAIGTKCVFKNKKYERGIVVRNKARLVAQGYTQEEGIDYDKVFALIARIKAIGLFLAYASYMGFIVYQMDVKSAFLYGTIEEEVYVCQPPGFEDPHFHDKVYKVEKALYGLHQAPRSWYKTLSTYLLENGFKRGTIDKTLFIKKDKSDILFQMSSMGELTFFLGLQVQYKEDGIFINQDKYVADILKKFDYVTVKTASTPMEPNKALVKDEEADNIVTPKTSHLHAVKRIFKYLKGQPKLGLWYPRDSPFNLEAFSDSDYAGASLDKKSTTGGCKFLGKRLISWQCKKQTIVLWIQNQMLDYGFNFMNTKIYIDNESTICIVKNPKFYAKTKHIEIRHHFIRDSYEKRLIQVIKVHSDKNVADILKKAFDVSRIVGRTCNIKRGRDTKIPQSGGPPVKVGDEAVYKELGDKMERAATTASSLEAEQDSELPRDILGVDTPLFQTMLVQGQTLQGERSKIPVESHHTPTSAPSTSQPPTSSLFMPTTHVAEEAALMPYDFTHLEIYGAAYTKLIMKVRKLEHKGRKIAKIDEDEGITLVQMGAQTQGRSDEDLIYKTGVYNYPAGYDRLLWGDLITRLFDSCGIHVLLMDTGIAIHMLVEKTYPFTQEMLSRMPSGKLEDDNESEMAFELLRFTRSQIEK
ncbi:putative ribonuclease H-like domain-containing protein [Tanacetum coccineum]